MENIAQQIIDLFKSIAPDAWAIGMQQVRADIWKNWLIIFLSILLFLFLWSIDYRQMAKVRIAREKGIATQRGDYFYNPNQVEDYHNNGRYIVWAFYGINVLVLIMYLSRQIQLYINPEYSAIQYLLRIVQ